MVRFTNWMQMELGLSGGGGEAGLVVEPSVE